jgi:hypothetical protein
MHPAKSTSWFSRSAGSATRIAGRPVSLGRHRDSDAVQAKPGALLRVTAGGHSALRDREELAHRVRQALEPAQADSQVGQL